MRYQHLGLPTQSQELESIFHVARSTSKPPLILYRTVCLAQTLQGPSQFSATEIYLGKSYNPPPRSPKKLCPACCRCIFFRWWQVGRACSVRGGNREELEPQKSSAPNISRVPLFLRLNFTCVEGGQRDHARFAQLFLCQKAD